MNEPTPEQIEYALRWMEARGKEPYCYEGPRWAWWGSWSSSDPQPRHRLPWTIYLQKSISTLETYQAFPTREDAVAALAVALVECREACEIPEAKGGA